MLSGTCLCGNVTFSLNAHPRDAGYCHCNQCRKQSGHYWACGTVDLSDIDVQGAVKWFAASAIATRGFCPTCGSFLFWKGNDATEIGVSLGLIDGPTGIAMEKHIFVAFKGDYYDITDDLPQEAREQ